MASLPEFRRNGATKALITEVLGCGSKLGFSTAQVSFYIDNHGAEALYQQFGFERQNDLRDSAFEQAIGAPGMIRLKRGLPYEINDLQHPSRQLAQSYV